jgi:hypothetical protein
MRAVAALMADELAAAAHQPAAAGVLEVDAPLDALAAALGLEPPRPADAALVVDVETLGLRSAPIFLVGILDLSARRVRQTLAVDYSGEVAMLASAAARLGDGPVVITYNGSTFDLPYLRERMAYWRMDPPRIAEHRDLLLLLRAKKTDRPTLRLSAVEEWLLGRTRFADVAGADLPDMYRAYVDAGAHDVIAPALAHNLVDLWSCGEIHALLEDAAQDKPIG